MKLPYERQFLVCTGGRCNSLDLGDDRGEIIRGELKTLNKALGRKKTVRVCAVSCLDLCDEGPNIVVWPPGDVYFGVDREKATKIYLRETRGIRESEDNGKS